MSETPIDPIKDPERLADLTEHGVLDTPPEAGFDRLTRLASRLLGAPAALTSLVDRDRQFFKSCIGLPEPWDALRETPLSHSFCQHVVRNGAPLVVEDARTHPLVRDNPAVAELGAVAYLGAPLVSDEGRVLGSFCVIDVKPRRWTEADLETLRDLAASATTELRLRRERNRLRQLREEAAADRDRLQVILDAIGDGVVAVDPSGRATFLNPLAERLTGWTAAQAAGRPVEEVLRVVDASTRLPIEPAAAGAPARRAVLIGRDGVERPIDLEAAPIKTAGAGAGAEAGGAVLVFRDVAERIAAERSLRESEARYRVLFDSIDEGFCIIEMIHDAGGKAVDYRFTEVNPAFIRQTGIKDAKGRAMREIAPDHEEHWFRIYDEVARTGAPVRFINVARALDGRWFNVYAFRIGGPGRRRVAILFNDASAEVESERRREELVERLKHADRMKDQFLAMLAHELRNPLSAIRLAAQVARLAAESGKRDVLAAQLEVVQRQTSSLSRLVDDLLDASRINQGKLRLRLEPTELRGVVERAVEQARPAVAAKRHRLTVSLPDRPIVFQADSARIEQVLGNLLTNAAKYTESGGSIDLEARPEGAEVVLRVKDDGVGIAEPVRHRIFDLFAQVEESLEHSQGGLGIGLTLVKNLVELHGGTVAVASDGPGEGSEFTVRLPLSDQTEPQA